MKLKKIRNLPRVPAINAIMRHVSGACRAVFFDLYDTLVYLPDRLMPPEDLRQALERAGQDTRILTTRTLPQISHSLSGDAPLLRNVKRLFSRFRRHAAQARCYPDAVPCLQRLRERGLYLGVISNLAEPYGHDVLGRLGIARYFDAAVYSYAEGLRKPDPEIYRRALAAAGVGPEEALMVGNHPLHDYRAAREMGMEACLLDRTGQDRGPGDLPAGSERIATLDELV